MANPGTSDLRGKGRGSGLAEYWQSDQFLRQKQRALESKIQAFRETDGIVWQDLIGHIDYHPFY